MQNNNTFNPNPHYQHQHQYTQFPYQTSQTPQQIYHNTQTPPQFHPYSHPSTSLNHPQNYTTTQNSPYNNNYYYNEENLTAHEQKLMDEVIYLHSLWHRGPPSNPLPTSSYTSYNQYPYLKPSQNTTFKKKKKKDQIFVASSSDKEWPVDEKPTCLSSSASGWGQFKPSPSSRPATAEERESLVAMRVQLKGLDSFVGLFYGSDDHDGVEDEDDDDDDDEEGYDEEEAYEKVWKLFEESEEMRGYYKRKCESGEFYCLVCGISGKKKEKKGRFGFGRKYKDCVALVQHSVSIAKTKKRLAHRAYARVVCKVLGWDIDRLPSFPSTVGVGSGSGGVSLEMSNDVQGTMNDHVGGSTIEAAVVQAKDTAEAMIEDNVRDMDERYIASMQGCNASEKGLTEKGEEPLVVSENEWPTGPEATCSSLPALGWGEFKSKEALNSRPATDEEREKISAIKIQLKGLDSCITLFHDGDNEDDDDDDEEEYDEEEAGDLLLKMFEDNDELKGYYTKKCEDGEFYCLICGMIGQKLGKQYKNCVALVQHSVSIRKTKKIVAHRAYGRVVCKVLGWDIDRLPSLPPTVEDAKRPSLEESLELKDEVHNVGYEGGCTMAQGTEFYDYI